MKVAIVGGPGIGKSTLVRQLGDLYHAPSEQTVAAHVARATALAGDDMKALMRLCNPAPARQMSPEEGGRYIAGETARTPPAPAAAVRQPLLRRRCVVQRLGAADFGRDHPHRRAEQHRRGDRAHRRRPAAARPGWQPGHFSAGQAARRSSQAREVRYPSSAD